VPQPTCHWRTAELLPYKGNVPAPERLNVTGKSMYLTSSPCMQQNSPPRTRTCRKQSPWCLQSPG
jgi:hypothetical protein